MICRLALVSTGLASAYNMGPAAATPKALLMSGAAQQLRPRPGRLVPPLAQQAQLSRRLRFSLGMWSSASPPPLHTLNQNPTATTCPETDPPAPPVK